MTYIHSALGVPCISTSEFWKIEADKEGREVCDLMSDFYDDLRNDEDAYRQSVIDNKDGALERLQYYYEGDDDASTIPTEVLEIWDANVSFGMRKNKTSFCCKVKFNDNSVRSLRYSEVEYSGSYMEPPDFYSSCEELPV
jgi:hypothetical protein